MKLQALTRFIRLICVNFLYTGLHHYNRCFNNLWHRILYFWVFIILTVTAIISLNSVNLLSFVMVKCGVLFEVRTEFLNII
jgi:hypothetical protein